MFCWLKIGLNYFIVCIVFLRIIELKIILGVLKFCYLGSIYNIFIGIWILDIYFYNFFMVFVKLISVM